VRHIARVRRCSHSPSTRIASKTVARVAQAVEGGRQLGQAATGDAIEGAVGEEVRDDGERRLRRVVDLVGDTVGAHLIEATVEHDHLAVEPRERSQAEVAVLPERADRHLALVDAFHQRRGAGDLKERAVVHLQMIGEGGPDDVVDRLAGRPVTFLERMPERGRDPSTQRVHQSIDISSRRTG
jgi:hypothetical protein